MKMTGHESPKLSKRAEWLKGNALPKHVFRGLDRPGISENEWSLPSLAGRVVEISGHRALANLTVAFGLVLEAQDLQEPVSWITLEQSSFYPPDVAESGIDLGRLAVVRLKDLEAASRAATQLLRSGGFGLVVLDMGPMALHQAKTKQRFYRGQRYARRQKLATPAMTKMVGLAKKHDTAMVLLTEKPSQNASLSSLVSLRIEARRNKDQLTTIEMLVLKDKRRGPGRSFRRVCHVSAGLR